MVQFYLPPDRWKSEDAELHLEGDEARHARDVFRLAPGDPIRIFDGLGSAAEARIRSASKSALGLQIEKKLPSDPAPPVRIDLAQALVPHETMDEIVRQASELGAARIWPVLCERSIVRLDAEKRISKLEHWKKTALAACKQCDRNTLPEVMPVVTAKELAEHFLEYDAVLAACPVAPEGRLDSWAAAAVRPRRILVAIGPEGDFSPAEMKLFKERGAASVTLGPLILRSDTAAAAALAVLQFLSHK